MNIHRAGKVGSRAGVIPPWVSKPRTGRCYREKVPTPFVLDTKRLLRSAVEQLLNASFACKERGAHCSNVRLVLYIHVRHLMITHGKCAAGASVQVFTFALLPDGKKSSIAQCSVWRERMINRRNSIFAQHNHLHATLFIELADAFKHAINLADFLVDAWVFRPKFLQAVIKVRQIDQM